MESRTQLKIQKEVLSPGLCSILPFPTLTTGSRPPFFCIKPYLVSSLKLPLHSPVLQLPFLLSVHEFHAHCIIATCQQLSTPVLALTEEGENCILQHTNGSCFLFPSDNSKEQCQDATRNELKRKPSQPGTRHLNGKIQSLSLGRDDGTNYY